MNIDSANVPKGAKQITSPTKRINEKSVALEKQGTVKNINTSIR